jgi:hypothetical protein
MLQKEETLPEVADVSLSSLFSQEKASLEIIWSS